jgi:hypothetical protein
MSSPARDWRKPLQMLEFVTFSSPGRVLNMASLQKVKIMFILQQN